MSSDINIKKLRNNEFRESKVRGKFMLSIRIPGSIFPSHLLPIIQNIADKYGTGKIHIQTRQKLSIPDIKFDDIEEVNKLLQPIIEEIEVETCGVKLEDTTKGYPTIGARNIASCIGNYHCIFANVDTINIARRFEKDIFPNNYHIKIAVAGCPNDCVKANFTDFGIMGMAKMEFDYDRCIGCGACVKACKQHATAALAGVNGKAVKQEDKCIGCGECAMVCPTSAWYRKNEKFFRVKIGGRTGRKTPRAGKTMFKWITEEPLHSIVRNIFKYEEYMLGGKPIYRHFGHLIDEGSYPVFRDFVLGKSDLAKQYNAEEVKLNPECKIADRVYWSEDEQVADIHVK